MKYPQTYVICETCKAQFPVKIYHKTVHVFPRVWKMYIQCPSCRTTYTSGYFDDEVKNMIHLGASRDDIIKRQEWLREQYDKTIRS